MVMVRSISDPNSSKYFEEIGSHCKVVDGHCHLSIELLALKLTAKKALGNVSCVTIDVISKPNISIARTTPLLLLAVAEAQIWGI